MALKVIGSNPVIYPILINTKLNISSIQKIKKKNFKKNVFLCNRIFTKILSLKQKNNFFLEKNIFIKYFNKVWVFLKNKPDFFFKKNQNIFICISQKTFNPKGTISSVKCLNTFSVGLVVKYFKIKQNKYIRRSLKGVKVFLNFLKNVFEKRYNNEAFFKNIILNIVGCDYNLIFLKKTLKVFLKKNNKKKFFFLFNLKISFTKTKNKKIKSIKKRLKKKILLAFSKSIKINNN